MSLAFDQFIKMYADAIGELKDVKKVPTKLLPLDYVTDGGIPVGRIVEFYGDPGTGKTTTLITITKRFLEEFPDKRVLYVDAESSFDASWAKKNGLDVEEMFAQKRLIIPMGLDSMDTAFSMVLDAVKTGEFSLIVLDSISALPVKEIYEESDTESMVNFNRPGISAKKQTAFISILTPLLQKSETAFVFVNQQRANISPYGASTTQPGAYALKHATTIRIELSRKDFYPDRKDPQGIEIEYKCTKNKVGIAYRSERAYILRTCGLDPVLSNINMAVQLGVIKRKGAYYYVGDQSYQGMTKLVEALRNDTELYNKLVEQAIQVIKELKVHA